MNDRDSGKWFRRGTVKKTTKIYTIKYREQIWAKKLLQNCMYFGGGACSRCISRLYGTLRVFNRREILLAHHGESVYVAKYDTFFYRLLAFDDCIGLELHALGMKVLTHMGAPGREEQMNGDFGEQCQQRKRRGTTEQSGNFYCQLFILHRNQLENSTSRQSTRRHSTRYTDT